jgi:glycosyltransferase involved in cell wall biosynthesis
MSLRGTTFVILTPAWLHGDGVGHDVEGMARALVGAGSNVYVYAPFAYAPAYESWRVDAATVRELLEQPETVLIYHHSIGCRPIEELLKHAKSRIRILRYHNVTPPEFFEGYNNDWVNNCQNGRDVTLDVTRMCNEYSVPSLYDGRDLVHAGAAVDRIFYLPYFHKLSDFDAVKPTQAAVDRLANDRRLHVLFLGRRVNNKGHLHLVRTVGAYMRTYDRDIALHLVGAADTGLLRYDEEIRQEIVRQNAEDNVYLYDKAPFADIVAYYRGCDAFLCMSEHEGFCIPVIEAEYCGLPVVAHYRRGVPEALGPTQPWLTSLNYDEYAHILRKIRVEPAYARQLSVAGAASVRERFNIEDIKARFLEWIEGVVANAQPHVAYRLPITSQRKPKVAFVVQRFGRTVAGGAESFARMYAERMSDRYDITVLTTTSESLDWDSRLQCSVDGEEGERPYEILRFAPNKPRNWEAFFKSNAWMETGQISHAEWLAEQGPNVPELRDFLTYYAEEFDLIVNWTYLYSTAVYASQLKGRARLVNVPFFHDEPYLYFDGTAQMALAYDSNVYQTQAEKDLAYRVFDGISEKPSITLGCGVEESITDAIRSKKTRSPLRQPYIVYVGRVELAKRVPDLVKAFKQYKTMSGSNLKLVIIGRVHDCDVNADEDIIMPGFISDEQKAVYVKHALCLVNPSPLESFSLVLLEAWAMSRPVLVNARCDATRGQVERSGGGLSYDNFRELFWCLEKFETDPEVREQLGANGRKFYEDNYRWERLVPKLTAFFDEQMRLNTAQLSAVA